MLSRLSPVLRTTLPRHQLAAIGQLPISRLPVHKAAAPSSFVQKRFVANPVSSQPGSSSLGHAARNVKEDIGAIAGEAGKVIKGTSDKNTQEDSVNFVDITKDMINAVPQPALIWGLAGTVPYAITAAATAWTARNATIMAASGADNPSMELLHSLQSFQITYGAVILSFLGAMHWGMEFAKYGGEQGHKRLALGVFPLAAAWPTLYMADPTLALVAQWGGFLATWTADRWATHQGWAPRWYSTYRFYLTVVAGGSLILSLAALNHYDPTDLGLKGGPGTQVGFKSEIGKPSTVSAKALKEDGISVHTDADSDTFNVISKTTTPAEDEKKKQEQAELAKEQAKKDDNQFKNSPAGFKEPKATSSEKHFQNQEGSEIGKNVK